VRLRFLLIVVLSLLVFQAASAAELSGLLGDIATLKDFHAMRASSSDPNLEGNGDARPIAPGKTLTLADLKGPGRVAHIWFTIADSERFYGKKLVLRMYWDGESTPSVEAPLNDFFCQGHGMDVVVNSLPFRVTSNGRGRNCYFPMPFGKSARIEVTNEGNEPCHAFYFYVDWQQLKALPKDTAYFHAKYRQEYPCVAGQDYLILDAVGRGQFVGCNLSVRTNEPGWWGEGDDRFYIDGESVPSLRGTGSEDYFCDGWGLRQQDGLFYGAPIMEGDGYNKRTTAYRFHLTDPIPFTKSLKMTIEHKGARKPPGGSWNGYLERADDFSSVAYWYQTEPHKDFAPLPPAEQRMYHTGEIVSEGPSLVSTAAVENGPAPGLQGTRLFFTPSDEKAALTLKVPVAKAGRYEVAVKWTSSWDYGIYQMSLNGQPVGKKLDLYTADTKSAPPANLGVFDLPAGTFELKLQCVGKNAESKGVFLGLEEIDLTPVR
jgi:hypothetical protein